MASTILIPDPDELEVCPYESSHMVSSRRMVYHLDKCRKSFVGQKKICPFNGKHRVPAPELNYHMSNCPDKAVLGQDLRYSGMKQSGFIDDSPCGDLKVPDDDFNLSTEESWESEIDANQSNFRLGRNRIESSNIPTYKAPRNEQLRLPSTASTNTPVYRYSAMNFQSSNLGRGRGRGRGLNPQVNGALRTEGNKSAQENNVRFGRGFGSSVAGPQQWQKSDSTTVSVNAVSPKNTFSLGIGRGLKKKENIESNYSNKTPKVLTLEELERQSRRLGKKLRQIAKLKEIKDHGTTLDNDEEMKLAKKETLEEELENVTSKIKSWRIK